MAPPRDKGPLVAAIIIVVGFFALIVVITVLAGMVAV